MRQQRAVMHRCSCQQQASVAGSCACVQQRPAGGGGKHGVPAARAASRRDPPRLAACRRRRHVPLRAPLRAPAASPRCAPGGCMPRATQKRGRAGWLRGTPAVGRRPSFAAARGAGDSAEQARQRTAARRRLARRMAPAARRRCRCRRSARRAACRCRAARRAARARPPSRPCGDRALPRDALSGCPALRLPGARRRRRAAAARTGCARVGRGGVGLGWPRPRRSDASHFSARASATIICRKLCLHVTAGCFYWSPVRAPSVA
jgi:hypothetical protein